MKKSLSIALILMITSAVAERKGTFHIDKLKYPER